MSGHTDNVASRGRGNSENPRTGPFDTVGHAGQGLPQGSRGSRVHSDNWRANAGPLQGDSEHSRRETVAGVPPGIVADGAQMTGPPTLASVSSTIVSIANERNREGADPNNPAFLAHIPNSNDHHIYTQTVLPLVATLVFKIESAPDLHFFETMLKSAQHPGMLDYVHKVSLTGFHWFSGVMHNRTHHPMLAFASSLPNLQELGLTFHTAGLTTSMWLERDRVKMERDDFEKSKQLRVLRIGDVVNKYGLAMLFRCQALNAVHLECIHSDMVAYYAKERAPTAPFFELVRWVREGFADTCGTSVAVTTRVIQKK